MLRALRRAAAMSALVGVGSAAALSHSLAGTPRPVRLATSARAPHLPTTVLVHGLDSSKETFSGVLAELAAAGYPAVALDLRGHGESPLGDAADFSAEALAADVLVAVRELELGPAVLVGHSMGGRIAMRAAAQDAASEAPVLASVVIEDMDLSARSGAATLDRPERHEAIERFGTAGGRSFATWELARAALLPWYDDSAERVDGWKGGRVRQLPDRSWWSDINPAAQRLARDRVLASDDGARAWDTLASMGERACAVHVWYADAGPRGTVCELEGPGSIADMRARFPDARFEFFAGAGHSIHNSARPAFMKALRAVVDEAALRTAR
jgi:pimeloyl-ACP methyl ester carboxylesterase